MKSRTRLPWVLEDNQIKFRDETGIDTVIATMNPGLKTQDGEFIVEAVTNYEKSLNLLSRLEKALPSKSLRSKINMFLATKE